MICKSFSQFRGPIAGTFLTPDNIRYVATTLHPTANIKSRLIHFSPGDDNDLLLEFPLGPQDPRNAYVITIALVNSYYNKKGVDADLVAGISDGTNNHLQLLVDANDYATYPPCRPINGSHDNNLVPRFHQQLLFGLFRFSNMQHARRVKMEATSTPEHSILS